MAKSKFVVGSYTIPFEGYDNLKEQLKKLLEDNQKEVGVLKKEIDEIKAKNKKRISICNVNIKALSKELTNLGSPSSAKNPSEA